MSVKKNPQFQVMKMSAKKMAVKKMTVKKMTVKKNPPVIKSNINSNINSKINSNINDVQKSQKVKVCNM